MLHDPSHALHHFGAEAPRFALVVKGKKGYRMSGGRLVSLLHALHPAASRFLPVPRGCDHRD